MARIVFSLLIGVGGLAILLWLGTWQVQRLSWKQSLLAEIETRIAAQPVNLPETVDAQQDRYLPVSVAGRFMEQSSARMLASRRRTGAVFRHIAPFETVQGRKILVDAGWTPADTKPHPLPAAPVTLVGNLDWPRERDQYTPAPDLQSNLWYARDLPQLSDAMGTEPILVVLREMPETDFGMTPWPVDTAGIPNDHLQYAITWFSLAAIWAGMTGYFMWRTRRSE